MWVFFGNIPFTLIVEDLRSLKVGTMIISYNDSESKNSGKDWVGLEM